MALAYTIRFFFAYANSDQNGEGCQAGRLSGGVQATIPTSVGRPYIQMKWPTLTPNAAMHIVR
jgi:hypothetical protein